MQPVTPHKLLLIAAVIGLGTAVASFVQSSRFPASEYRTSMPYARDGDAAQMRSIMQARKTSSWVARRPFVERTPFPYVAASGPLHGNRNLEFDD